MSTSLDHTVWLHGPVRVDGWVLSELHPVATGSGRGLALGSIRTADGRLLASLAQETLLRLPET
jgi:acyl-CoA thioesterase-2